MNSPEWVFRRQTQAEEVLGLEERGDRDAIAVFGTSIHNLDRILTTGVIPPFHRPFLLPRTMSEVNLRALGMPPCRKH